MRCVGPATAQLSSMRWACYCSSSRLGTEITGRNLSKEIKEAEKEKQNNLYIYGRLIIQVLAIYFWEKKDTLKHTIRTKLLRRLTHILILTCKINILIIITPIH